MPEQDERWQERFGARQRIQCLENDQQYLRLRVNNLERYRRKSLLAILFLIVVVVVLVKGAISYP